MCVPFRDNPLPDVDRDPARIEEHAFTIFRDPARDGRKT